MSLDGNTRIAVALFFVAAVTDAFATEAAMHPLSLACEKIVPPLLGGMRSIVLNEHSSDDIVHALVVVCQFVNVI